AAHEADADMRSSVAFAVARRSLRHAFTNPALLVPSILFPLVFLLAFAGGLSNIDNVPGFDFPPGYTTFQFVFVFLQSAAFGGVFTGFGIAADFESGFARRMLLAAPHRSGMLLGYAAAGMVRWFLTATLVTVASLLAGMDVHGSGIELGGLVPASLGDHVDRLYRAAWGLCGSREDAEDLVQETYVKVLAKTRFLRNDDDLGYLLMVMRNTFYSRHRSAQRRPQTAAMPED